MVSATEGAVVTLRQPVPKRAARRVTTTTVRVVGGVGVLLVMVPSRHFVAFSRVDR
jgi:hypothetical protein